jgi:hypothetical protein
MLGTTDVDVASLDDVIQSKRTAGRPKDIVAPRISKLTPVLSANTAMLIRDGGRVRDRPQPRRGVFAAVPHPVAARP